MIKRDFYLNKLINKKNNGRIKFITGIRKCGKSYLLFNLYKDYLISIGINEEQIITISLNEPNNFKYRNPFKLNDYIKEQCSDKNKKYYIFIDEIELCKKVNNPYSDIKSSKVSFVDVLLGLMKKDNLDLYIISNNSKKFINNIPTDLRDRYDIIQVNPLGFIEIVDLFDNQDFAYEYYNLYGGMPYIYNLKSDIEKKEYLKSLIEDVYLKDIINKYNIQNEEDKLIILLKFIASSAGLLINPNKISNQFLEANIKISSNTISKYLSYFEELSVIYSSNRYDIKKSKYLLTPLKYFIADIGIRNAILGFEDINEENTMKNIIYNELYTRDFNIDTGFVEFDYKKPNIRKKMQLDIDFVINKGSHRYYLQSIAEIDSIYKKEQVTTPLIKVKDSFKKIVVVKNNIIPRYDESGIYYVGIKEFLFNQSILN